jgi:hypothetical protein
MGRYVGKLIAARVAGNALPAFRYRHPGDLATIGRRAAVVKLNRVHLKGFIGCAHLLPDRAAPSFHRGVHLVVGLPHSAAQRALDHRSPAAGSARGTRLSAGLDTEQRHHTPLNQLYPCSSQYPGL